VNVNKKLAEVNKQTDFNFTSQQIIIKKLTDLQVKRSNVNCVNDNWDSLFTASKANFKSLSSNNSFGIENTYYSQWMSKGQKKELGIVPLNANKELKDLEMLLHFLKENDVKPVFIISPLNTLAHTNLPDLAPTVDAIKERLNKGHFNYLDMFTSNLNNYEIGVLEDVMHPYDYGWYIMDKFIAENLYCKNND
jgi:poly-D-alanine transfer protein DltD